MRIFRYLFLLVFCGFVGHMNGQEITDAVKRVIKERVEQKVGEFTNSLSMMVTDSLSHRVRKEHQVLLLHLFIGKGDPYKYDEYYIDDFDKVEKKREIRSSGVKMYTSSLYRKGYKEDKLKRYILKLYDPETGRSKMNYYKIKMEFADHIKIGNIEEVGDHYECAAIFIQRFYGFRDGGVYIDETVKKIRCYIKYTETIPGKGYWDIKLGDIHVLDTRPPKQ